MHNLHLEFAYTWAPWLFLLLIPVFLLTFIPYFRLDKRYRKTRNRIVSMVLHILIMVFSVCVLTGFTFVYEVDNLENEMILLVDVSDTEAQSASLRDEYVRMVLDESGYDDIRVGIVKFGFTQVNAVPFTYDTEQAYKQYLDAELPDTTATDIAAALRYASSLFGNPEASKIVLITDGKETDERAVTAINSIVARGTRVDVINVASEFAGDTVQVLGVNFPDYHIGLNEEFPLEVTIRSRSVTEASVVEFYDNGVHDLETGMQTVSLIEGNQTVIFRPTFTTNGLHKIEIKVSQFGDTLEKNNSFCAYYYLDFYNRVLIIEQQAGESEALSTLLAQEGVDYEVDILNLKTAEDLPDSAEYFCEYDQVILNNIANDDIEPLGIDQMLYSYVHDYGGGLFTVGGSDEDGEAHAYNRLDMLGSVYQQMLPVEVINYTPPVGVVIIIDISGSMSTDNALYWAKQGAIACLPALTSRDYIGVMTLATSYGAELPMTPYTSTYESYIRETILAIDGTGGTDFAPSIARAGQMLSRSSLPNVDRRHMIIVSDGALADFDEALQATRENYELNGITLSFVGINNAGSSYEENMRELVKEGHGKYHNVSSGNIANLTTEMHDDLNAAEIKEADDEPFHPQVNNALSPILNGVQYGSVEDEEGNVINRALNVQLGGFYGVKARTGADVILIGNYEIPLYAQWKFGKGMVGCFMSDLNGGAWSSAFLGDPDAQRFLFNVVANLMPTENIRPNEISATLSEENYINQLNIYTTLEEGQTVRASITDTTSGTELSMNEVTNLEELDNPGFYVTLALTPGNYTRCNFIVKESGIYRILIEKLNADGSVAATYETYKQFSFSLEYVQDQEIDPAAILEQIARRGKGNVIDDAERLGLIFENFVTDLQQSFDPRWLFMGLAMALFLLDLIVRKFKFKWPHELIRERKEKKNEKRS